MRVFILVVAVGFSSVALALPGGLAGRFNLGIQADNGEKIVDADQEADVSLSLAKKLYDFDTKITFKTVLSFGSDYSRGSQAVRFDLGYSF